MAWTAPMTALDNTVFTSAQFNQQVRDNLLETMPGKAATAGSFMAVAALNSLAERVIAQSSVAAYEATSLATYGALTTPGPAVTATTGTSAIVFYAADTSTATTNTGTRMSYAVSGATAVAASDAWNLLTDGINAGNNARTGRFDFRTGLTAGSNTFTAQYRSDTAGVAATFGLRSLCVIPL